MPEIFLNEQEIDIVCRALRIEMIDYERMAKLPCNPRAKINYEEKANIIHAIIKRMGR